MSSKRLHSVRLALAAAVVSLAGAAYAADTPRIDQATLLERIKRKDSELLILDVRTPEEFAKGHVPGAVNVPYTHLPARISDLPGAGSKDIVLYCETGIRSERAAERLREHGYTRLKHLEGDMQAWQEQKRPVQM